MDHIDIIIKKQAIQHIIYLDGGIIVSPTRE